MDIKNIKMYSGNRAFTHGSADVDNTTMRLYGRGHSHTNVKPHASYMAGKARVLCCGSAGTQGGKDIDTQIMCIHTRTFAHGCVDVDGIRAYTCHPRAITY
jgi:hypothetical protein